MRQSPRSFPRRTAGKRAAYEVPVACAVGSAAGVVLLNIHPEDPAESVVTVRVLCPDHTVLIAGSRKAEAVLIDQPVCLVYSNLEYLCLCYVVDRAQEGVLFRRGSQRVTSRTCITGQSFSGDGGQSVEGRLHALNKIFGRLSQPFLPSRWRQR